MYQFNKQYSSKLQQFKLQIKDLTQLEIIKLFVSGIIGLIICVFTSAVVNTTLVEISLNILFAFYFGICFIAIGVLLILQINNMQNDEEMMKRKPFLFIFGCLVLVSGFFCIFLEENWFIRLYYLEKIPLYMLIAISLNFSIIFSIIDLLNFFLGYFQQSWQKAMVETPKQIVWVLLLSMIMGLLYGLIFGLFDVEDARGSKLDIKLIKEEYYCIPFAGFLGFFGGMINELVRQKGDFVPFNFERIVDPFSDEI